jgi:hypothetical protein
LGTSKHLANTGPDKRAVVLSKVPSDVPVICGNLFGEGKNRLPSLATWPRLRR